MRWIFIDGICKNQYINEAISVFRMMEYKGAGLDIRICNNFIESLRKNKKFDAARNIFDNGDNNVWNPMS